MGTHAHEVMSIFAQLLADCDDAAGGHPSTPVQVQTPCKTPHPGDRYQLLAWACVWQQPLPCSVLDWRITACLRRAQLGSGVSTAGPVWGSPAPGQAA